jgi:hypothetical protein
VGHPGEAIAQAIATLDEPLSPRLPDGKQRPFPTAEGLTPLRLARPHCTSPHVQWPTLRVICRRRPNMPYQLIKDSRSV